MANNLWVVGGVTGAMAMAAGVGLGHYLTKWRLEALYYEVAQEEIAEAKEYYRNLYGGSDAPEKSDGSDETVEITGDLHIEDDEPDEYKIVVPESVIEKMASYQGHENTQRLMAELEELDALVDPNGPFIISIAEYMHSEVGYDQHTVTYFEGDGVMIDEKDEIVPEARLIEIIGLANLKKFGQDSDDEDAVYVRCNKFKMDFEVIRSHGLYSVEVAGLSPDSAETG